MDLQTHISQLNRVGKSLEKRLKHLGIETVQDLLFYFPFRYEDFSQVKKIKDLQDGDEVSVRGKIELIASKRSFRARKIITEAVVADETERLKVIWFGQPFISKVLKPGDEVFLSGKVTMDMFGAKMVGPAYERARPLSRSPLRGERKETTHTARIVPMYSLTEGITNKQMRFLMSQVVGLVKEVKEWLPDDIRDRADVMGLAEAIKAIHFPESDDELKHAERRLKFDELYILQLRGEMIRQSLKKVSAPKLEFKEKEIQEFVKSLPFTLTKKQKISAWEILQDMGKSEPMNRLLEGDVGSGKTVVAAMAMYNAALNGFQAVIMAPTEILARQHFESLCGLFAGLDLRIGLVTRSMRAVSGDKRYEIRDNISHLPSHISPVSHISKSKIIKFIQDGEIKIIIGTHALLTESVEFGNLGLVIVDEQHRFGVEQRKILKEKMRTGEPDLSRALSSAEAREITPHFLSMTATPIPRSFALTVYGDLDLSIIDEMPVGRKLVKTRLVEPRNREKAYDFIRAQVKQGRQAFVICPLIDNNQNLKLQIPNKLQITNYKLQIDDKKTVLSEYEKLSKQIFPDLKIGFVHGKLKATEKEEVMKKFSNKEIDVLVSTSVVEVGVNIPNASVMMIEGAERFGLAQLHQFRGRVGRAEHQSYCFLFTDNNSDKVMERLKYFEKENSGFKVAEYDLDARGPGEVYGTAQSGMMNFKIATLQDKEIIKLARELARGIDFGKYPGLRERVREWEESVHLE